MYAHIDLMLHSDIGKVVEVITTNFEVRYSRPEIAKGVWRRFTFFFTRTFQGTHILCGQAVLSLALRERNI